MPEKRPSKSIRLPGYDYASPGAYFVTICAHQRRLLFDDREVASVIEWAWKGIPSHFTDVSADAFVVMPNHVHGIIFIGDSGAVGARHASPLQRDDIWLGGARAGSLGAIVGSFKAVVTRELRRRDLWSHEPFWQRNYYERIIRDDAELNRIREYIAYNPVAWLHDHENPEHIPDNQHIDAWLARRHHVALTA